MVLDNENQEWVRLEDEYNMSGLRTAVIASLVPHIYIYTLFCKGSDLKHT